MANKLPFEVRSSFTGRVGVRIAAGNSKFSVDFHVEDGIVRYSIPALSRFKNAPLSEVEDWYNRHTNVVYECRKVESWSAVETY